jgi:hypothetical protein
LTRFRAPLAAALLAATVLARLGAQAATTTAPSTPAATPLPQAAQPEPYGKDEFHPFLRGARRFETVAIGSYPLTVFYTSFFFDCYRLITKSIEAGAFDDRYMPWPFKSSNSVALTNDEKTGVLLAAASASILVAVIDIIILRAKERADARRKAAFEAANVRKEPPADAPGAGGVPPPGNGTPPEGGSPGEADGTPPEG